MTLRRYTKEARLHGRQCPLSAPSCDSFSRFHTTQTQTRRWLRLLAPPARVICLSLGLGFQGPIRRTGSRIPKTALRRKAVFADFCGQGSSQFFTHAHWDLETTMTTFKNNIILRARFEHSELWQFEDRQMGAGELDRAPKASCFKELFPIIRRLGGELRPCGHRTTGSLPVGGGLNGLAARSIRVHA